MAPPRAANCSPGSAVSGWYDEFAAGLAGGGVPRPLPSDAGPTSGSSTAVGRDLRDPDGRGTVTGVRVIWTGDHLDAVRRLQGALVAPAQAAADGHVL